MATVLAFDYQQFGDYGVQIAGYVTVRNDDIGRLAHKWCDRAKLLDKFGKH